MGLTISFSTLLPTSQPHKVVVVLIFKRKKGEVNDPSHINELLRLQDILRVSNQ